jgi:hypothetical protein
MIMHHITLCTPVIAFILVSHTYIFAIDHVEQGREEPSEPAPIEDANPAAGPRQAPVHLTLFLSFVIILSYFLMILDYALD